MDRNIKYILGTEHLNNTRGYIETKAYDGKNSIEIIKDLQRREKLNSLISPKNYIIHGYTDKFAVYSFPEGELILVARAE